MSTWGDALPRRDTMREARRTALVRQAAQEFRKRGYHATSMGDIARALGVSKGALYRYVRSKDEVLYACFKHSERLAEEALVVARAHPGSAAERLRVFLVRFVGEYLASNLAGGAMVEIDALSPPQRQEIVAGRDRVDAGLTEILQEGVRDGSLRADDTKLMILAFMGSINWIPSWFRADGALGPHAMAERIAAILLDGLRSRPPGKRPSRRLPLAAGRVGA